MVDAETHLSSSCGSAETKASPESSSEPKRKSIVLRLRSTFENGVQDWFTPLSDGYSINSAQQLPTSASGGCLCKCKSYSIHMAKMKYSGRFTGGGGLSK